MTDATLVSNAYINFGKRVQLLRTKLKEERLPQLEKRRDLESISPMPR